MIKEWKRNGKSSIKGKIGILFLIGLFTSFTGGNFGGVSFNSRELELSSEKEIIMFFLIMLFILIATLIVSIASIFIIAPFTLSRHYVYLKVARGENVRFVDAFYGFKDYWASVRLYLLTNIYIYLWSFLLLIPGIVAMYKYSFAFYYLAENPRSSAKKCIKESKELTYCFKGNLFLLDLSFIGWNLLVLMTLGILGIWVYPYRQASYSTAYLDLSTDDVTKVRYA